MTLNAIQLPVREKINVNVTDLCFEDVRSITRFDEHDLILVGEVKRFGVIHGN